MAEKAQTLADVRQAVLTARTTIDGALRELAAQLPDGFIIERCDVDLVRPTVYGGRGDYMISVDIAVSVRTS